MERFAEWGCHEFLLMLNHKANLIRAYFADLECPTSVDCVVEPEPLGTAGALSLLADRLDQTFFLPTATCWSRPTTRACCEPIARAATRSRWWPR